MTHFQRGDFLVGSCEAFFTSCKLGESYSGRGAAGREARRRQVGAYHHQTGIEQMHNGLHSQLGRKLDGADRSLSPHRRGLRQQNALRLPLTHRLSKSMLGGSSIFTSLAVGLALVVTSCTTFHGKSYLAWDAPRFVATSTCVSADRDTAWNVQIKIQDDGGRPITGVFVKLASSTAGAEGTSDRDGVVKLALPPGRWVIEPDYSGRQDGFAFALPEGNACTSHA